MHYLYPISGGGGGGGDLPGKHGYSSKLLSVSEFQFV